MPSPFLNKVSDYEKSSSQSIKYVLSVLIILVT
ncbi:hypothetical protein CLTEP_05970 [Clostridium tepidiprofundi DSM 19306]|uniref:Uncharacterized protein n=1 Tax=Clostridium tepidiprofundi DSM 19306 TaxID=1121338 RepID=A0A151B658_9CLOT|nr:hypothetical protein CLTEP_05970 [Clostridium tepidiprofundi DSM 19306]